MAPVKQLQEYESNKENKATNTVSSHNDDKNDDFLLSSDPSKYVTLPVHHEKLWRLYQTTLDWFWTVHDIYITDDRSNMLTLFSEEQRHFLLDILAFIFTTHYTTVTKDLFMQLMSQIDIKEASYYFGSQADSKKTHSMMYSMLIDELASSEGVQFKNKIISDMVQVPEVKEFLKWINRTTSSSSGSLASRLLAFAALQGIIFTGPFLLFKWISKQHPSKMRGLCESNDLIRRDEALNLHFTCLLFDYIDDELTVEEAHKLVEEAVRHAKVLFTKIFPFSILGIDCELLEQYIECLADKILTDIGLTKLFNKEKPFDWADEPKIGTFQTKIPTNNTVDMSNSFGEAKFSTELDF